MHKWRSCLMAAAALLSYGAYSQMSHAGASANSNVGMGLKLFDETCAKAEDKINVVVSPSSALFALGMTANGAAGATEQQMLATLGAQSISQLNSQNKDALSKLTSLDKSIALQAANAIFVDNKAPVNKTFTQTCKSVYGAEATNLDFAKQEAVDTINKWCSDHTQGKIPTILNTLSPQAFMVLINAIYFKGTWEYKFKPEATQPGPFKLANGKEVKVDMMSQTKHFNYLEEKDFKSVELRYKGGDVSMFILLPNKDVSVQKLRKTITAATWDKWMQSYKSNEVYVQLPKFKVEFSDILNTSLKSMGMPDAFDPDKANFSKMVPANLHAFISLVIQKTYMDVNESGTEAAAVTAVVMETAMARMEQPKTFQVDRPFILALRHNPTGELLFLGEIVNPKGK